MISQYIASLCNYDKLYETYKFESFSLEHANETCVNVVSIV